MLNVADMDSGAVKQHGLGGDVYNVWIPVPKFVLISEKALK